MKEILFKDKDGYEITIKENYADVEEILKEDPNADVIFMSINDGRGMELAIGLTLDEAEMIMLKLLKEIQDLRK